MKKFRLRYFCTVCGYGWKSKKPPGFDPAKCPRCNSKNIKRDLLTTGLDWMLS